MSKKTLSDLLWKNCLNQDFTNYLKFLFKAVRKSLNKVKKYNDENFKFFRYDNSKNLAEYLQRIKALQIDSILNSKKDSYQQKIIEDINIKTAAVVRAIERVNKNILISSHCFFETISELILIKANEQIIKNNQKSLKATEFDKDNIINENNHEQEEPKNFLTEKNTGYYNIAIDRNSKQAKNVKYFADGNFPSLDLSQGIKYFYRLNSLILNQSSLAPEFELNYAIFYFDTKSNRLIFSIKGDAIIILFKRDGNSGKITPRRLSFNLSKDQPNISYLNLDKFFNQDFYLAIASKEILQHNLNNLGSFLERMLDNNRGNLKQFNFASSVLNKSILNNSQNNKSLSLWDLNKYKTNGINLISAFIESYGNRKIAKSTYYIIKYNTNNIMKQIIKENACLLSSLEVVNEDNKPQKNNNLETKLLQHSISFSAEFNKELQDICQNSNVINR